MSAASFSKAGLAPAMAKPVIAWEVSYDGDGDALPFLVPDKIFRAKFQPTSEEAVRLLAETPAEPAEIRPKQQELWAEPAVSSAKEKKERKRTPEEEAEIAASLEGDADSLD